MLVLALSAWAHAAPPAELGLEPNRIVSLGVGLSPLMGSDAGGGGLGQLTLQVHLPPFSLEAIGGEGAMSNHTRTVGFIGIGLRKHIAYGTWARVLLAHHHETLWGDFVDHPAGALAGVHTSVTHRTGVDVGVGWDAPLGEKVRDRVVLDVGAFARVFPGAPTPPVYAGLQVGVSVRLGPEWKRKHRGPTAAVDDAGGVESSDSMESADGVESAHTLDAGHSRQ